MEHYSILDPDSQKHGAQDHSSRGSAKVPVPFIQQEGASLEISFQPSPARSPLAKELNGGSLAEMAERDLRATLQLLVERAQYITGASAASIALRKDEAMICCARTGEAAPEIGTRLQINAGLTGESIRARETLRCDNAETDSRVNQESCRTLGIVSVMVMPLLHQQEVTGVFELLSSRPNAFEERDVEALQHLREMVQTAIERAVAIKRSADEIATKNLALVPDEIEGEQSIAEETASAIEASPESSIQSREPASQITKPITIRTCAGCGFPVSEGRKLCLDCEAAEEQNLAGTRPPAWLAESSGRKQQSWLRANIYTIGTVTLVLITLAILLWTEWSKILVVDH
jgi:putative methionine-R-sulfoxide reductase with GAF domain